MKKFKVQVLNDEGAPRVWVVIASTTDDALQLAFALDGGWSLDGPGGDDSDASEMMALAKSYCSIVQ